LPDLSDFQAKIRQLYGSRDAERGLYETFAWLVEEVGELSRALRRHDRDNLEVEFADVVAWLVSVANLVDVDVAACVDQLYGNGCPRCSASPCACPMR
jgi:NTP pyrophosphatase (non-canonical NTP hydrolase)